MGLDRIIIPAGLGLLSWAIYRALKATKSEIPESDKKNVKPSNATKPKTTLIAKPTKPIQTTLKFYDLNVTINGHNLTMIIDSGCHNSIISKAVWQQLGEPPLEPSPIKRWASTGFEVHLKGQFSPTIQYGGKIIQRLHLQVSDKLNTSNLIGRNWFPSLNLDWNSILHCSHTSNSAYQFQQDSKKQHRLVSIMANMYWSNHFYIDLKLQGVGIRMILDTGASLTRINQRQWEFIGRPTLEPTRFRILDTAGEERFLAGQCSVTLEYRGQQSVVLIVVSKDDRGDAVIGTNMFKYIQFDFNAIFKEITFPIFK